MVRLALRGGVNKGVPFWITALQLAEAWHIPPWEIMRAPGALRWAHRHAFYKKQVQWVDEFNAEQAKKK